MSTLYQSALDDLSRVFARLDHAGVERAVDEIAAARRIALYGCGREGLQIKGLAMRLFHLGLNVAMVGDMTTPAIGPGDLFIVSGGPGLFSTGAALAGVARAAGARVMLVTAQPDAPTAAGADTLLVIPAQTMADDRGAGISVLPMGSLFEGAEYIVFEIMILMLRDKLGITSEAMRANHTNME
jgi:6-phospho-3-hexuloisomerase